MKCIITFTHSLISQRGSGTEDCSKLLPFTFSTVATANSNTLGNPINILLSRISYSLSVKPSGWLVVRLYQEEKKNKYACF